MTKIIFSLFLIFLVSLELYAQEVSGVVKDENNKPMAGVFIKNEITKENTVSISDGTYTIKAIKGTSIEL